MNWSTNLNQTLVYQVFPALKLIKPEFVNYIKEISFLLFLSKVINIFLQNAVSLKSSLNYRIYTKIFNKV